MEPNGLRHRECKIHMTYDAKIEKEEFACMQFNGDGDLLAVTSLVTTLPNESGSEENLNAKYGKLQLYHRSNYHWYLKYEIRYDGVGEASSVISKAMFSKDDPYRITVALHKRIHYMEF